MKRVFLGFIGLVLITGLIGCRETPTSGSFDPPPSDAPLPVKSIEDIIQAQGDTANGVLEITIERTDIGNVQGVGFIGDSVTFTPSFEIHGDIFFQPLGGDTAFLNGDMALKQSEVDPFIKALLNSGLVFQAYHQHFPMNPQIWFVHFRGKCNPIKLAKAVKAALNVTSTRFPQTLPQNPTTPLDTARLAKILDAQHISIGNDGVVTAWVYRRTTVTIDGVVVNPQANISTSIEFKPLGGSQADVMPDFSMKTGGVDTVVHLMSKQFKWQQGCLYNQETGENPQLYFDHMLKVGDAYTLAEEIRRALDLTDAEGSPKKTLMPAASENIDKKIDCGCK